MLEKRVYKFDELADYLGTRSNQGLRRKLTNNGIQFEEAGRGRMKTFAITDIADPFKVYCIFDLGIDYRTDFKKFRDFVSLLLSEPDFSWRPMEMMEEYMRIEGNSVSRQTIANYIRKLNQLEIISTNGEMVYYKVFHDGPDQKHEIISNEEYCAAWDVYWDKLKDGYDSRAAFSCMHRFLGGSPRKQARIVQNAFYLDTISTLSALVADSFLREMTD